MKKMMAALHFFALFSYFNSSCASTAQGVVWPTVNQIHFQLQQQDLEFYKENLGKLAINIPLVHPIKRHLFKAPLVATSGLPFQKAEIETRGKGCLFAFRKCFGVEMDGSMALGQNQFKKFDLISMREDIGYTNLHIGMNIFSELKMFFLKRDYVQLFINNANWGLYTIVDAPNYYFKTELKTPFAGRTKGPLYRFGTRYFDSNQTLFTEKEFLKELKSLTKMAKRNHSRGDQLYRLLKEKMDIDQYLKLIGVQNLLQNGDYSDEVYFYVDPIQYKKGKIYFKVMTWDTDVLFSEPHSTPYNNILWKKRLSRTLFYSMENKLDRTLAKDAYINLKMAVILKQTLEQELTYKKIKEVMAKTKAQITPYLQTSILAPSTYDFKPKVRNTPYTLSEIVNLLQEKEMLLLQRRLDLISRCLVLLSQK